MSRIFVILLLPLFIYSCKKETTSQNRFVEHTLVFANTLRNTTDLNILNYLYYYNGAGVALGDFNNDSLIDIYLTGNQTKDALFLNRGKLQFDSITIPENQENDFSTGVTTVDINNDGLLDIYVCQISNHLQLKGHNRLYVNQGIENGVPIFKEESQKYSLALSGFFTQASFFDYDLDGDLDVYFLKHSVHPNSNYNRGSIRYKNDSLTGDLLFENKNSHFEDVTLEANILQTKISYGLGLSTADVNNDGYPDIYVGNDFFENDYLYINQQDGTFKEVNTTNNRLKHSTHFSMGNDIADLTNDGLPEIVSVDMLPENLQTLKAAGTEYGFPIYQNQLKNGYQPQYMQNTLHLNRGEAQFTETAFQSSIAATEWSWSPLLADFDADGLKDIFISNGIAGATNDMDFINFISNDEIQQRLGSGMKQEDLEFIKKLPQKKTPNYFYKNNGNLEFQDVTDYWFSKIPSFSNGASYGDLDNDGDLDIVINNVNEQAQILENKTSQKDSTNYLKFYFTGLPNNTFGIGTKTAVYTTIGTQYFENSVTRGFMSSVPPEITIGIPKTTQVDSVTVVWPGGTYQTITDITLNKKLTISHKNASGNYYYYGTQSQINYIKNIPSLLKYKHQDATSLDFSRDPLIPYAASNLGPKITIGDLNNNGLDDIVALGAKSQKSAIYFQQEQGSFIHSPLDNSENHRIHEDVHSLIFDANSDGKNDLLIVSGGNEFMRGKPLEPRLYIQEEKGLRFRKSAFENISINASTVSAVDIDNDGDLDLSISANIVPREFGKTPSQYIFENDGQGNFSDVSETIGIALQNIGNVYDIKWVDIDNNGFKDVIVTGHWMPITLLLNDGKTLQPYDTNLSDTNGWWNTIEVADFDKDGDLDIIAGNWGANTRLKASKEQPIQLYRKDFDDNGRVDPLVTYFYQDQETAIATKDELVKQLPFINKKFLSYNAFAKAKLDEIFTPKQLKEADRKQVNELQSMYFENTGNGTFKQSPLPFLAQVSTIFDIQIDDFNNDSYLDVLLVGNNYEISTQLGRLDGSQGLLLLNDQQGFFEEVKQQKFNISGPARSIEKLDINGKTHYIVGLNNSTPILLQKVEE